MSANAAVKGGRRAKQGGTQRGRMPAVGRSPRSAGWAAAGDAYHSLSRVGRSEKLSAMVVRTGLVGNVRSTQQSNPGEQHYKNEAQSPEVE
jgi:hypothetical protein